VNSITKKRVYLIARLLFIIPGVAIGILFYGWANKPSSQPIKIDNPTESPTPQATAQPNTVSTDYFIVQFPARFKVQTNKPSGSSQLLQILSYEPNSGGLQIGIVSNALPDGGLNSVADYNLRKMKPAEYQPTNVQFRNNSLQAAFQSNDQSEISVYLVDRTRYASVTITGPAGQSDTLQRRLEEVLSTWQWL